MEPNYKEMYFKLMAATADAIEILIQAHNECEELYISAEEGGESPQTVSDGR